MRHRRYVQNKEHPRWLWHAIDHRTGEILAYAFGDRGNEVFLKLKEAAGAFRDHPLLHGRLTGAPTNATCHPHNTRSARRIPKRSNESI